MMRYSMDDGTYHSPLNQGRVDKGNENLEVRLLHVPKQDDFVRTAFFGEFAHAGGNLNPIEAFDALSAEDIAQKAQNTFGGALGQFMEADTVTFLVYGCSRAFTHEIVRTRKGAWFLQQTFRHSFMGNANVRMPEYIANSPINLQQNWTNSVKTSVRTYMNLSEFGDVPYQDARSVLPIATETWIIVGMPLRTFFETYNYRACTMFLPEMVYVMREMGRLLKEASPWLAGQIKISCEIPQTDGSHKCYYRGVEKVEGYCSFPWAKEDLRLWKSSRFTGG